MIIRYAYMLCLLSSLVILACGGNTELDLVISSQPEGGENISTMSCTYEGQLVNGTSPIKVTVEWWGQHGSYAYEEIQKRESHTFTSENVESVTTTLSAPTNYVWTGHFYVKFIWEDEDGTDHELESNQVHCYL